MSDVKHDLQSGAALITALVITALMAITAVAVLDMMRFSYRVAINTANRDQARLYLLGAEKLAAATIKTSRQSRSAEGYPELDAWTREPILFPIDGGQITGRIRDGANCFNLNSIVELKDNGRARHAANAARFQYLLELVDVDPTQAAELTNSLIDWIDSDSTPEYGGAEDPHYMANESPYRTSGSFLADVTELYAISGFIPPIVRRLSPFVCTYPNSDRQALNINSLTPEQAPVLLSYLGAGFDMQDVDEILAERPVNGFKTIEEFYLLPVFQEGGFPEGQSGYFALKSEFYTLTATVIYYETAISLSSTLEVASSGLPKTLSRKYG